MQIANPVSFLAQKLLIHRKRDPGDRAKDILYVHDTLQTFGHRLEELRGEWMAGIVPHLHPKVARTVANGAGRLFAEMIDTIRQAALLPADRQLSPEAVRESCRYGLKHIFT